MSKPRQPVSSPAVIAFIGGGNMAASLVGGLLAAGYPVGRLRVAEPLAERRAWLQRQFGVTVHAQAREAVAAAGAVVLAVKPQQMRAALEGLALEPGTAVISIAAGVRLETLRRWLGDELHYVRTMPNTPALLARGISGLFAPAGTPAAVCELAQSILRAAGETVWLPREDDLDAVTALSGSGPAYFFLLTELLREAGEQLGLEKTTAAQLARQTFVGAAAMAARDADVAELRAQVTSKGGTTEAAIQCLDAGGLRALVAAALAAATRRSRELGEQLQKESQS